MHARTTITNLLHQIRNNQITEIIGNAFGSPLTPQDVAEFAEALKTNTSVTNLSFNCQSIGPAGAASIAGMLRVNRTLQKLELWNNKIGDQGAASIASALEQNTSLQELGLGFNRISDASANSIAGMLARNQHLVTLKLTNNTMNSQGITCIANALKINTTLSRLELGNNTLDDIAYRESGSWSQKNVVTGTGAEALANALKVNTHLKELSLCNSRMGPAAARYLILCLQRNNHLELLDLGDNLLGVDGGVGVAELLLENRTIKKLYLSMTGMDWVVCATIAKSLQLNTTLQSLSLSFNQVNDEAAKELAISLGNNSSLQSLNLSGNRITEQGLNRFRDDAASGKYSTSLKISLLGNDRKNMELCAAERRVAIPALDKAIVINAMGVLLYNDASEALKQKCREYAARFFAQASTLGNAVATYNLGLVHQAGCIGGRSPDDAAYYFQLARQRGYVSAAPSANEARLLERRITFPAAFTYDFETPLQTCKAAYQGGRGFARLAVPHVSRLLGKENILHFARQHNYTYYGHANNLEGNINQQPLEGFNFLNFLPIHIFYLFQMLIICEDARVSDYLKNELRGCMEMHVIVKYLQELPNTDAMEKDFFVIALHQALKISQLQNKQEYTVAISYKVVRPGQEAGSHIVYVNFANQDGNIVIRVDNLGHDGDEVRHHEESGVRKSWIQQELVSTNNFESMANHHRWPVVLGVIKQQNISTNDLLLNYLIDLCRARYLNYDAALPLIYSNNFRHTTNGNEGYHAWFFTRKFQNRGNCVFKGMSVGMDIRSQPFDPDYDQPIGDSNYRYADHQNPKRENPKKKFYRDIKRLLMRAAEDRNNQEIPLDIAETRRLKP